ncbi:MAG: phosphomannomutase/phosphoglucomutase [Clostridiales bacterium]|nr:phosphomannomutase/phosphoglucomutase [Clostridiales bacterium]
MAINWRGFKSGSDIRGLGTAELDDPLYLSNFAVEKMTAGFVMWLSEKKHAPSQLFTVSVGYDSRLSSERIKGSVVNALTKMGVGVKDCGLCSTPAMFMTTVDLNCDGAVMITASHLPKEKNGLKFFTRAGGLGGKDIEYILDFASKNDVPASPKKGEVETVNYINTYAALLRDMIIKEVNATDYARPLRGYKIAVDAGNGVGGFYAEKVLQPLGADISGSRYLEPDGNFPNHIPNPENKAAMDEAASATVESKSDLGIVFDTDVDRAACVGPDGTEINRNALVAIASYIALQKNDGGTIVTDSVTSDGLTKYIESLGGKHLRYKRGYRNVIDKQIELNESGVNCPLAIETSGHAAFKDNYFLDDGAYLVTKIIIKNAELGKQGKSIFDVIETLEKPVEEKEIRLKITKEDFRTAGELFINEWTKAAEGFDGYEKAPENYEGVRFSSSKDRGDGWILARLSVHDPVIVINAESDSEGGVEKMTSEILCFAEKFDGVEI